jgi:type I restriction-modification system DNA methylase subunit
MASKTSLINSVTKMQEKSSSSGREIHRRGELIKLLENMGFKNYLNDVGQGMKRPDLRFYETSSKPDNYLPCKFFIETKDFGEIPSLKSLPVQQIFKYVHLNSTALTSFAATDFQSWYLFRLDSSKLKSLKDLFKLSEASVSNKEWKKVSGDERGLKILSEFLVTPVLKFSSINLKNLDQVQKKYFDTEMLKAESSWIEKIDIAHIKDRTPEELSKELASVMHPIVGKATSILQESESNTKPYIRFRLWVKQRGLFKGDFDQLASKDRTAKEDEQLLLLQEEFAWLASYSVVNVLYLVRGLEERGIINKIIDKGVTADSSKSFFNTLWNWLDSDGSNFVKDFIRIQKVYCDWLISKLDARELAGLVNIFATSSLLKLSDSDLLGRLYESLMQQLDSSNRKKFGQYYTPKEVSEVLWDISWKFLNSLEVSPFEVTTLDPGAGSGMLLCRGVDLLVKEMNPSANNVGQSVRDLAKTNINGFEINPLSAAVSRINLYFTYIDNVSRFGGDPESSFVSKVPIVDIPVFNTNSYHLGNPITQDLLLHSKVEGEELEAWKREESFLERTKNRADFLLLIGNPPYCGNDESVASGEADHLKVWTNESAYRRPNSGVREALLHYMGLADSILRKGGKGMIAFVTSDTWLNNYDHEIVRKYFLRRYNWKGVLFLGPNMFQDAKVSTCLVFLQLRKEAHKVEDIYNLDIPVMSLSVEEEPEIRFKELNKILAEGIEWTHVAPDKYGCVRFPYPGSFSITNEKEDNFISIADIFKTSFPACETGADQYLTAITKTKLAEKVKKLLDSDSKLSTDPDISGSVKDAKTSALRKLRTKLDLSYSPSKIKNYLKFNGSNDTFGVSKERHHFVYFEPDLLHRSIMQKNWNPHEEKCRIAFNMHEQPARACLVPEGYYLHRWQHMRFAPSSLPDTDFESNVDNYSTKGKYLRSKFESDVAFFDFLVGCINSNVIQISFKDSLNAHASPIPLFIEGEEEIIHLIGKISSVIRKIDYAEFDSKDSLTKNILKELAISSKVDVTEVREKLLKELNEKASELYAKCISRNVTIKDIEELEREVESLEVTEKEVKNKRRKKKAS